MHTRDEGFGRALQQLRCQRQYKCRCGTRSWNVPSMWCAVACWNVSVCAVRVWKLWLNEESSESIALHQNRFVLMKKSARECCWCCWWRDSHHDREIQCLAGDADEVSAERFQSLFLWRVIQATGFSVLIRRRFLGRDFGGEGASPT